MCDDEGWYVCIITAGCSGGSAGCKRPHVWNQRRYVDCEAAVLILTVSSLNKVSSYIVIRWYLLAANILIFQYYYQIHVSCMWHIKMISCGIYNWNVVTTA